ncbi:protein translocase subunit SecF [Candidatus Kuenenbacteria bacterium]|nr:protein translocase subunit SecF [Candidatus Kuenenbacteria bacterium]
MLRIIQKRNIFFILSGTLVLVSIAAFIVWGLKLSIDFTGGSLSEISFIKDRPNVAEVRELLVSQKLNNTDEAVIQPAGSNELIIRTKTLTEDEHQQLVNVLKDNYGQENVVENRFESIGPVIGQELQNKAIVAVIIVLALIITYIAFTFRKVSKPMASWKYGLAATIALVHDVTIITGAFVLLGHYLNIEVGLLFVTALLTLLGYSVNDTIVVFDRIRENLIYRPKETFAETVNQSANETIARSINTSLTALLVLLALYFLGGVTIKYFVLALILGIIFGTYSSIFIASALLVSWHEFSRRKR